MSLINIDIDRVNNKTVLHCLHKTNNRGHKSAVTVELTTIPISLTFTYQFVFMPHRRAGVDDWCDTVVFLRLLWCRCLACLCRDQRVRVGHVVCPGHRHLHLGVVETTVEQHRRDNEWAQVESRDEQSEQDGSRQLCIEPSDHNVLR